MREIPQVRRDDEADTRGKRLQDGLRQRPVRLDLYAAAAGETYGERREQRQGEDQVKNRPRSRQPCSTARDHGGRARDTPRVPDENAAHPALHFRLPLLRDADECAVILLAHQTH